MSDIYKQHEAAFSRVSAYVILKGEERVATIALKFPADGSGNLYAYVHWLGVPMVRGHAGGYGYDKRSSAVANAARKIVYTKSPAETPLSDQEAFKSFRAAIETDGGEYWDTRLRNAGFTIYQAV